MKIDSNRLNATEHGIKLDPKLFKSDPAVHWLARVISVNIELYRLDLIGAEPPGEGLLGGVFYTSEATPWYELLTNGEVLKAIVRDTSWELDTLCKVIVEKLKPPNWELFFWMGHALKAFRERDIADRDQGRMRKVFIEKLSLFNERDAIRKQISSDAGKKSGEARRRKGTPDQVIELYKKNLRDSTEKHLIAHSIANKVSVTAQHVRKIIRGFKKDK